MEESINLVLVNFITLNNTIKIAVRKVGGGTETGDNPILIHGKKITI